MLETVIKNLTAAVTELTAAITGGNVAAAPAKPAPAPKAKATPETAPVPVSEPAPTPEVVPTPDVAEPVTEVVAVPTKKVLVEKFIQLAQEKDREIAVKLLADFDVTKLPELKDKTKWAAFVAECDALLAA